MPDNPFKTIQYPMANNIPYEYADPGMMTDKKQPTRVKKKSPEQIHKERTEWHRSQQELKKHKSGNKS